MSSSGLKIVVAVKRAIGLSVELLQRHGAQVEELELPPEFERITDWHKAIMDCEGRASFLGDYATSREGLHQHLIDTVENRSGWTRAQQLEAYDSVAALRSKFDQIAKCYAGIITPSVPDSTLR